MPDTAGRQHASEDDWISDLELWVMLGASFAFVFVIVLLLVYAVWGIFS